MHSRASQPSTHEVLERALQKSRNSAPIVVTLSELEAAAFDTREWLLNYFLTRDHLLPVPTFLLLGYDATDPVTSLYLDSLRASPQVIQATDLAPTARRLTDAFDLCESLARDTVDLSGGKVTTAVELLRFWAESGNLARIDGQVRFLSRTWVGPSSRQNLLMADSLQNVSALRREATLDLVEYASIGSSGVTPLALVEAMADRDLSHADVLDILSTLCLQDHSPIRMRTRDLDGEIELTFRHRALQEIAAQRLRNRSDYRLRITHAIAFATTRLHEFPYLVADVQPLLASVSPHKLMALKRLQYANDLDECVAHATLVADRPVAQPATTSDRLDGQLLWTSYSTLLNRVEGGLVDRVLEAILQRDPEPALRAQVLLEQAHNLSETGKRQLAHDRALFALQVARSANLSDEYVLASVAVDCYRIRAGLPPELEDELRSLSSTVNNVAANLSIADSTRGKALALVAETLFACDKLEDAKRASDSALALRESCRTYLYGALIRSKLGASVESAQFMSRAYEFASRDERVSYQSMIGHYRTSVEFRIEHWDHVRGIADEVVNACRLAGKLEAEREVLSVHRDAILRLIETEPDRRLELTEELIAVDQSLANLIP